MKKVNISISSIDDIEIFIFDKEFQKEMNRNSLFSYLYDNISISKTALFQIYLLGSHINFFKEDII